MPQKIPSTRKEVTINLGWLVRHKISLVLSLAVVVSAVTAFAWGLHQTSRPEHVFKAMLADNFATTSVTRSVDSSQEASSIQQVSQLSFKGEPRSRSVILLTQKAEGAPTTTVKTETIGTPTTDYSQYVTIDTQQKGANGKKLDYSKVEGLWGQAKAEQNAGGQYLNQAAIGLVAFGNLSPDKRSAILSKLYSKRIYQTDYSKAQSKKNDGNAVWEYQVKVNVADYVPILQEIGKLTGITSLAKLDAASYAQSPPVTITMSVAKRSHQLVKVSYPDGGQTEVYSGYNLNQAIQLPERTMPLSDLQQLVQAVQ